MQHRSSWFAMGGIALILTAALPVGTRFLPGAETAESEADLKWRIEHGRNDAAAPAVDALGMHEGKVALQSASELVFGPSNVLFLADARAGQLYALDVKDDRTASFPASYQMLNDLDLKVAALLGTTRDQIRFGDMATHPRSGALYFTVTRLWAKGRMPALVRVGGPGAVELVNLDQIRFSQTPVPSAPPTDTTMAFGQPAWSWTVTDLNVVDNELWVAGMSNEQFSSALRRVPFPFGSGGSIATVEIFHTVHNKWETNAPIQAFMPITINGVPSVMAGYGCSPIATFTVADLRSGGHRRGKTVAELGGGNRPIDFLRYQHEGKEMVLIANSNRTLLRMDPADIATAAALTSPVTQPNGTLGVKTLAVSSTGIMQMADLDADRIVILVRDTETGAVNLQSYPKKYL